MVPFPVTCVLVWMLSEIQAPAVIDINLLLAWFTTKAINYINPAVTKLIEGN
jgi:hypothetical protein